MIRLIKIRVIVISLFLCLCIAFGLTSCKSLPEVAGTQVLQVGDRRIESYVRRHESAAYTLVFESGARNCIQRWEKVLQQVPANVNVYAYNRPGYCNSSASASEPSSQNIAHELRLALRKQGLNPPYVLIGHSIGGLYMQHFARQYPREVHGLVLVDAMYPGLLKSPNEFPWYTKMGMRFLLPKAVREEINLAYANGLVIDALPAIDDKPIVRMFNVPKGEHGTAIAVDFGMFNSDEISLDKMRKMYPHAKIVVADSSHQMQETSPELVIQAINDVLQAHNQMISAPGI
jgi:pimeloyl-ACP methyl ester carboxylesterase